jgi:hypothetical protein
MGLPGEFQDTGGTESARTRGWSKTTRVYLAFQDPLSTPHHLEHIKTTPNPPTPQKSGQKTRKRRRRRQKALRRFLVMSATIGRNSAPDFDGAHPQGVHSDSLESSKSVGKWEVVETPALRAFFERAASAINLYVF